MKYPVFLICVVLLIGSSFPLAAADQVTFYPPYYGDNSSYRVGPLADKVVFAFTPNSRSLEALFDNEGDLVPEFHPKSDDDMDLVNLMEEDESFKVSKSGSNSYGAFYFNCQKYPFNLTGFRQAISLAYDKIELSEVGFEGRTTPVDSVLPTSSIFSIEDDLPYHYYESDMDAAKEKLDVLGIIDQDGDSYREGINGTEIPIHIKATAFPGAYSTSTNLLYYTLLELGFETTFEIQDFYETLPQEWYFPLGNFDIAYSVFRFNDRSLDWMPSLFCGGDGEGLFQNPSRFKNETLDYWLDRLVNSSSYQDVHDAAERVQLILHEESPFLRPMQSNKISAHRTDRFTGFTESAETGFGNFWNLYHPHLLDSQGGPFGGTLRIALEGPHFFNPVIGDYVGDLFLSLMYEPLIRVNPTGYYEPWLSRAFSIETHDDNPLVPEGHMRVSLDLAKSYWSDSTKITAYDVVETYTMLMTEERNRFFNRLQDIYSVVALTEELVRIEFSSDSYWHLETISQVPILPSQLSRMGDAWYNWAKEAPESEMITSGPFNISDHVLHEFTELTYNPNYFLGLCRCTSWMPIIRYPNTPPENQTIVAETSGNAITWAVGCSIPYSYSIFIDDTEIESALWIGGAISTEIDYLDVGIHNVTLEVTSYHFVSTNYTVVVTVITQEEYMFAQLLILTFWAFVSFSITVAVCMLSIRKGRSLST